MFNVIQPQHVQYIALGSALLCFLVSLPSCQYDIVFTPPWKKQSDVTDAAITFFTDKIADRIEYSKQNEQAVFIDFYTVWCGPCKRMDRDVFSDARLAEYVNRHFISLKVDAEKGEGKILAQKFGFSTYPTLVFLDAGGNEKSRMVGFSAPKRVLNHAKKAL